MHRLVEDCLMNWLDCISLGCYKKYHRSGDLTEVYFSQLSNLGSLRSGCQQIPCLVRVLPVSGWQMAAFSFYPYLEDRKRANNLSHVWSYKGTNTIHADSRLITSQRLQLLLPLHCGLGLHLWIFSGCKNIQSITLILCIYT